MRISDWSSDGCSSDLVEMDRNARMSFLERADHMRQETERECGQRGDMKVAGGKIANIVGRFLERINADEAALDLMVKIFGFGRYREGAAFRSHKKLEPDGIFKVSEELVHRRLRQVHSLCGLRDRHLAPCRTKRSTRAKLKQ